VVRVFLERKIQGYRGKLLSPIAGARSGRCVNWIAQPQGVLARASVSVHTGIPDRRLVLCGGINGFKVFSFFFCYFMKFPGSNFKERWSVIFLHVILNTLHIYGVLLHLCLKCFKLRSLPILYWTQSLMLGRLRKIHYVFLKLVQSLSKLF